MEKGDIIKSILSILVIIILAVLILNADKLISPRKRVVGEDSITPLSGGAVRDYRDCFSDDPSAIVFLHSNSCPHCRSMMPIIEELEEEGYNFYWAESSDSEARDVISNCFSDIIGGYVPQFICPATGNEQTGAMSKDNLREFADDCV